MNTKKSPKKHRLIGFVLLVIGLLALVQWLSQNFGKPIAWSELIYPVALLLVFSGGVWTAFQKEPGFFIRGAMGWLLLFVACYIGYVQYENYETKQALSRIEGQSPDLILKANNGHFYVDMQIDGKTIRALIDTGASDVVLTEEDARNIGIVVEDIKDYRMYSTANGDVMSRYTRLDKINLNDKVTATDVRTSISEAELNQSLVGQSFLNKMSKWQVIKGNEMHIWE